MKKMKKGWQYFLRNRYLYLLLIPCVAYYIIFQYLPMYGIVIAFKEFSFAKGIMNSPWVGLENFKYLFSLNDFYRVLKNALTLSLLKLLICFPIPVMLALMLNEIPSLRFKKAAQTVLYLPYFISWVVIGGILTNLLSPSWGFVNGLIKEAGGEAIFFLGNKDYFRGIVVISHIWKQAGWDTIIYLAAITSISSDLYEAARIDGADRFQRIRYITLPCIKPTIIILLLLSIGNIMNNGFEQINVLQNNNNLVVSEVFETFTYHLGMVSGRFSFATTVGMFSSTVGLVLLALANKSAKMMNEEGIF